MYAVLLPIIPQAAIVSRLDVATVIDSGRERCSAVYLSQPLSITAAISSWLTKAA